MEIKKTEINYIDEMKKITDEVNSIKQSLIDKKEAKVETKKEVKVETKVEQSKVEQNRINEIESLKKTVNDLKNTIKSQFESSLNLSEQKSTKKDLENLSEII